MALDLRPNGTVQVDAETLRTSHERIWAGGDVAQGPRNLIDAVADGKRAAASIHATLAGADLGTHPAGTGRTGAPTEIAVTLRPGFRRLDSGYDAIPRVEVPTTQTERRVGFAEVEVGYDDDQARREAIRCLRCFDDIMLEPSLCILCGLCVDICPTDCITITRADRLGVGQESQSALVLDEDRCIRCALCVNRCPPGALSMVHAREVVA